jgi:hypothetical protein
MKWYIKDLYIQILKIAPNKNVDYINISSRYPNLDCILTAKKAKKEFSVQEFINNMPKVDNG